MCSKIFLGLDPILAARIMDDFHNLQWMANSENDFSRLFFMMKNKYQVLYINYQWNAVINQTITESGAVTSSVKFRPAWIEGKWRYWHRSHYVRCIEEPLFRKSILNFSRKKSIWNYTRKYLQFWNDFKECGCGEYF